MKTHLLTLISCLLFSSFYLNAQPGTLDLSFDFNGKVNIAQVTGKQDASILTYSIDSNDKVVILYQYPVSNKKHAYSLCRLLNDGSLDKDFGTNGNIDFITVTATSLRDTTFFLMILLPPDKILVSGKTLSYTELGGSSVTFSNLIFKSYYSDGSLDSSYGENGTNIIDYGDVSYIENLTPEFDGKYFAYLDEFYWETNEFQLNNMYRNNADGSIDYTYDALKDYSGDYSDKHYSRFAFPLPDHRVYIVNSAAGIFRTNSDGSLDKTFGDGNGLFENQVIKGYRDLFNLGAPQPDGKTVYTSEAIKDTNYFPYNAVIKSKILRLDSNGNVDRTFGTNGRIIPDMYDVRYNFYEGGIASLCVDSNRNIIFTSSGKKDSIDKSYLTRLTPSGVYDSSFGVNGNTELTLAGIAKIQSDNKILVAAALDTFIYRYNNNDFVLPVNITSFTATKKESSVLLNWKTCSEINSKGFYVQRSNNNTNWTSLGYVVSKGGGYICNNEYNFTDTKPINGNNFYRLKQVDNDSKFTYSKTVSANFIIANHIKISPNPVKDILMIEGLSGDKKSQLTIINASGKILKTVSVTGPTYSWNLLSLASGLYYLTVEQDDKIISKQKFVKEN